MDDATLIRVLKALAHPTRFRMVQEIAAAGELSCGAVGDCVPIAQPTTSHHLKILADAGVLLVRREAQLGMITVNREVLDQVAGLLPGRLTTTAAGVRRKAAPASAAARKPAKKPRAR